MILKPHASSDSTVHVDMMPLIDSLFVLLAFFLMAISTMVIQKTLPITMPESSTAQASTEAIAVIAVDKNEVIYWQDAPIALADLARVLGKNASDKKVIIRADENVRQKIIVKLLDITSETGIHSVMIQTR